MRCRRSARAPKRQCRTLTAWTPSANSGATLQTMGQSALQGLIASPTRPRAINMCSAESIPPSRRWRTIIRPRPRPPRPRSTRRSRRPLASCRATRPRRAFRPRPCRAFSPAPSQRCFLARPGPRTGRRRRARIPALKSLRARRSRPRPTPTSRRFRTSPRLTRC